MRTEVTIDVNWEGREDELGNVVYGWHLGTVCVVETALETMTRYEVYMSHPQPDESVVVMNWSAFGTREQAIERHDLLVSQLKELGEHGLYARRFESRRAV